MRAKPERRKLGLRWPLLPLPRTGHPGHHRHNTPQKASNNAAMTSAKQLRQFHLQIRALCGCVPPAPFPICAHADRDLLGLLCANCAIFSKSGEQHASYSERCSVEAECFGRHTLHSPLANPGLPRVGKCDHNSCLSCVFESSRYLLLAPDVSILTGGTGSGRKARRMIAQEGARAGRARLRSRYPGRREPPYDTRVSIRCRVSA